MQRGAPSKEIKMNGRRKLERRRNRSGQKEGRKIKCGKNKTTKKVRTKIQKGRGNTGKPKRKRNAGRKLERKRK
jgi:hypothetical protein